jgi:hypothetical protein
MSETQKSCLENMFINSRKSNEIPKIFEIENRKEKNLENRKLKFRDSSRINIGNYALAHGMDSPISLLIEWQYRLL